MRPLQLFLIAQWSMASQLLCFLVRLNEVFFHHLKWWEDRHNLTCGVPLTSPKTSTWCMDSLTTGWGATLDAGDSVSGTWTPQEAEESINFLEMMAIYLALSHFSSRLQGQTITQKWGEPAIDLFATRLNKQLLINVSPSPDPQAFDTIALSMDRDVLPFLYLFPPSPILPVVLQKVKHSSNTFLVIAPLWPHQSWYPDLISLSMDHPLCIPQREDLQAQTFPGSIRFNPTRVCSDTTLGCCPGAPLNSRFFGKHCGPNCLASERLQRTPLQCQAGGIL